MGGVRKDFLFYEKNVETKKRAVSWRGKNNSRTYMVPGTYLIPGTRRALCCCDIIFLLLGSDKNLLPSERPDSTCPPEKSTEFLWRAGDYKSGDSRSVRLPLTTDILVHNLKKDFLKPVLYSRLTFLLENYLEFLLM
mgnify:CR=1 FL=1